MKVLYLVHDLSDPAVAKRIAMLRDGGASVPTMGFRRASRSAATQNPFETVELGETRNGRFVQRIAAVLRTLAGLSRYRAYFADADVIIARNLEMLAIGVRARALAGGKPVLIYECLDIHRLLLSAGPAGIGLRALEGWLSKRAAGLITSSPAFVTEYFEKRSRVRLPVLLVENKVYAPEGENLRAVPYPARPAGPPWRIGWFGAIRCRESLGILKTLVRQSGGRVEVVIRGRPAYDQFDDFDREVSDTPGLQFLGPYRNPDDLAGIYRDVHFNWAIDRFEAGLNSSWLLPNRLYEGGLFAAVPIAEASVETGQFLERLGIGVLLAGDLKADLNQFFSTLTDATYKGLEKKVVNISLNSWTFDPNACKKLVEFIRKPNGSPE